MGRQIEALAQFAADIQWANVPEAVRSHTRLVVLDTLGVMLAGSDRSDARQLQAQMAPAGSAGATILGRGWPRSDAHMASLLNGISGRSIELCEGLRLVSGQPAIQILPGLLAAGEQRKLGGTQLLSAFLAGYDIGARLCMAFKPRPIAHQNGQANLLAAAAAGARLRGLDAAGISLSMRIAASMMATPSYNSAVHGATALNVAGGMSCFAAVLAPELALAGLTALPDAIEESLSQLVGDGFDPAHLTDELGQRWEITRNYFRLYACCNPIHPALDALQAILRRFKVAGSEIERIDIATFRLASTMCNPDPPNYFASKYSLPHVAAAMIVKGAANHAAIDDAALLDPGIIALRHRIHVAEAPEFTARGPRYKPARVTIRLKDGRTDTELADSHRGDFYEPFPELEIREKFRELAGVALTDKGISAVEQAIDHCESWQSVTELFDLLRAHQGENFHV